MPLAPPVIVVPGITATYLSDAYPLPPETVWSVLTKDYERTALHPDDPRYELREPARVQPGQIFEVAYEELIEELRYNLRDREDRPVPVYPFGYDWRQPLEQTEQQLLDFVDEVITRTALMKHYYRDGYAKDPKVNLVGHSMGGLVIAGYLQRTGNASRVAKVATLATPFQGSFEAVIKITTGTANLGTSAPSSRERETARLMPALYHLIPSFANGLETPPRLPNSLFDSAIWQPSIVETIAEFIRLHGREPGRRREQARELFDGLLAAGHEHRQRVDAFRLEQANLQRTDWLCVVGVNAETRVNLKVVRRGRSPDFELQSSDRRNDWNKDDVARRRFTGDGTVPFEGALPKFLGLENLVCVSPDDYGYWEIQDRTLTQVAGFHGILPNMNMLHRLIVRHFTGRPDRRGNTWGRAAPGVEAWDPPIRGLRERKWERKPEDEEEDEVE